MYLFLPISGSITKNSGSISRKKFRIQPDPDSQHRFFLLHLQVKYIFLLS